MARIAEQLIQIFTPKHIQPSMKQFLMKGGKNEKDNVNCRIDRGNVPLPAGHGLLCGR